LEKLDIVHEEEEMVMFAVLSSSVFPVAAVEGGKR
jgi:nitrate reductase NapE component